MVSLGIGWSGNTFIQKILFKTDKYNFASGIEHNRNSVWAFVRETSCV